MKIIGKKEWREWLNYDIRDEEGFYRLKDDTPIEIKKEYEEYKAKIKKHREEGFFC